MPEIQIFLSYLKLTAFSGQVNTIHAKTDIAGCRCDGGKATGDAAGRNPAMLGKALLKASGMARTKIWLHL